ncbi:MAG TPA: hypothetical protein VFS05_02840 [Gemmatimonadaceae bacterium]|nr:hypothetical protein [Gemmatimonadaceae bacterium]
MLYDDINQPRRDEDTPDRGNDARGHRPVPDREVPLKRRATPRAVHAWLDGDLPEAAVRRGDMVRDVEFWHRLNEEAETRRHMRTPAHVFDQIMEALPQTTPTVITPWWRRPFAMTPMTAAAIGAGVLAVGAAVVWIVFAR